MTLGDGHIGTLVDAYLDESLTAEQHADLESTLAASAEMRAAFWSLTRFHGMIHEACAEQSGGGIASTPAPVGRLHYADRAMPKAQTIRTPLWRYIAAAAVVLIAAPLIVMALRGGTSDPGDTDATTIAAGSPVAVLTSIDGAVMQASGASGAEVAVGESVHKGAFSIGDGRVELAFDDGSSVAITGPASFRVDGPNRAVLERGRLSASAKSGFTVVTPHLRVVDLGTAFSVVVDDDDGARVQVFRGRVRVEWTDAGDASEAVEVAAWRSVRVTAVEAVEHGVARAADAASIPSDDPMDRLVAWYRFDGDAANAAHGAFSPATMSNGRFVEGRAGLAAEFTGRLDSWIDLPIDATPTAMPKLTWGAWVRPTVLVGQHREVLSTDAGGYRRALTLDPRTGTTQAAADGGRLHAAAFGGSAGVVAGASPAIETNQWRFVAAVYDAAARTVTVYSDDPATGALVRTVATGVMLEGGRPVIRVGNHAMVGGEAFAGLIDEVFIFADALSAEQIEQIRSRGMGPIESVESGRE